MGLGIYIHFPYCVSKCGYCDFSSFGKEKWPKSFDNYVSKLITEAEHFMTANAEGLLIDFMASKSEMIRKREIGNYKNVSFKGLEPGMVDTLYFGGGTPSLMSEDQIMKLMEFFKPYLNRDAEVTMECNPGTVDYEKLVNLRKTGINRLSIGLQATQDKILKKLGRIHSFKDFENTIEWAKLAGFENLSADIMFGLPDQNLRDWKETIETVIKSGVCHISAYGLKVEEDTAFDRLVMEGVLVLPEVELERAMYHRACEIFESEGFAQYEISNFAKPGMESRHNLNYWEAGDYIGLGLNSHSKIGDIRFWNYSDMIGYEESLNRGKLAVEGFELLDKEERIFERIILSLRLNKGMNLKEFKETFGEDCYMELEPIFQKNIDKGYLVRIDEDHCQRVGPRIVFTKEGRDLSNQVYIDFLK